MRRPLLAFVLLASSAATLPAQDTAVFRGEDGNWFNPRNWSTGRVPDADTNVLIEAGSDVVIDPEVGDDVRIRNLTMTGGRLTTLPGTKFHTRNEWVLGGSLFHRSTEATCDGITLVAPLLGSQDTTPGMRVNPTSQSKRTIVLQSSVQFGLGGEVAASPGNTGRGHYANVTTDWGLVGGDLKVDLHYGFTPTAGQSFTIIRAKYLLFGRFNDLPEGALVKQFGDVGLYISYRGGDGCDVVLTARSIR